MSDREPFKHDERSFLPRNVKKEEGDHAGCGNTCCRVKSETNLSFSWDNTANDG